MAAEAAATQDGEEPEAPRRLTRSRSDRVLAGVAGGIGDYFDVDPVFVRIAFVAVTIFSGGLGILLYVIAAIAMPLEPESGATLQRSRHDGGRTAGMVLGLLLVTFGAIWLLRVLDLDTPPFDLVLALALIVVGLGLLWGARGHRHGGLIVLGAVIAFLLAAGSGIDASFDFDSGFGERTERPRVLSDLEDRYDHAFGSLTVDLRDLDLPDGTTEVEVDVAFGEAIVWLPEDVPVRVEASTQFGESQVLGREANGVDIDRRYTEGDYADASRRLLLDLNVVFGSAKVHR